MPGLKRGKQAGRPRRRPFLAALAAALSLFAAAPAAADVLVSNTGQTPQTDRVVHINWDDAAQGFWTGHDNPYGYSLTSVEINFATAPANVSVKLMTGISANHGGTVVATFTNPSSLTAGILTFTAPADTTLSASNTYYIIVEGTDGDNGTGTVQLTASTAEDAGGAANASIYDWSFRRTSTSSEGWTSFSRQHLMIRINAAALSEPNSAPTVANEIPDQDAMAGTAFSYAFPANTFADDNSDTLTYTATKGDGNALPSWLTFTASTRTFSGTPQAANAGTLTVKVTADDGHGGTVSDSFDIAVNAAPTVANEIPDQEGA